jgi:hypothetical protein
VSERASDELADLGDRLAAIGEELADRALDRLRASGDAVRAGENPDPALVEEERRITRARRAVEKAVILLGGPAPGSAGLDDGP